MIIENLVLNVVIFGMELMVCLFFIDSLDDIELVIIFELEEWCLLLVELCVLWFGMVMELV